MLLVWTVGQLKQVLYYGSLLSKSICMASNGAKEPFPSWSLDPEAQKAKRQVRKSRYVHSRSAPLTDLTPPETNGNGSIPRSESIYGKLNPTFRKVAIYLAVYLGVGIVIFYLVRHQIKGKKTDGVLDALYFIILTMTTVLDMEILFPIVPLQNYSPVLLFSREWHWLDYS